MAQTNCTLYIIGTSTWRTYLYLFFTYIHRWRIILDLGWAYSFRRSSSLVNIMYDNNNNNTIMTCTCRVCCRFAKLDAMYLRGTLYLYLSLIQVEMNIIYTEMYCYYYYIVTGRFFCHVKSPLHSLCASITCGMGFQPTKNMRTYARLIIYK